MAEPTTSNKALVAPLTGDLVGAWGTTAVNANMNAIDGMLGGVLNLSFAAATSFNLTAPSAAITPSSGPTQSQNMAIHLSGTLTGNVQIGFTLPGIYLVDNSCITGAYYVQLMNSGGLGAGSYVGCPPGFPIFVYYDGTNVRLVNAPPVGSYLDLAVTTSPLWMTASSFVPYLPCNGLTYNISAYPQLGNLIGSTFGGNGITTFAVPDLSNRFRIPLDLSGSNRVTAGGAGISGTTLGAAGGDQSLQAHTHAAAATVTDPGHSHTDIAILAGTVLGAQNGFQVTPSTTGVSVTNISVAVANATTGVGGGQNMPPSMVAGITFIKT